MELYDDYVEQKKSNAPMIIGVCITILVLMTILIVFGILYLKNTNNQFAPRYSKKSIEYIKKLKTDKETFLEYINNNQNFSNDFKMLYDLCQVNPSFFYSE